MYVFLCSFLASLKISPLLYNKSTLFSRAAEAPLATLGGRRKELRPARPAFEPDSNGGSTALGNALAGVPTSNGRLPVDLDGAEWCLLCSVTLLLRPFAHM